MSPLTRASSNDAFELETTGTEEEIPAPSSHIYDGVAPPVTLRVQKNERRVAVSPILALRHTGDGTAVARTLARCLVRRALVEVEAIPASGRLRATGSEATISASFNPTNRVDPEPP